MDEKTVSGKRTPPVERAVEIPAPKQEYNIKRRGARVILRTGTRAKLQLWDVGLIDLSRSGALIEHTQRVQVGELYQLSFQLEGLHVSVKARAVRSFVSHRAPARGSERQLLYRTGMEFAQLTSNVAEQISAYLERLRSSEFSR